ncbi:MAG: efflux RND transporter permease subunit [Planctomycetota bacterium]|nr:MAG: efflux RND transporter permease subunit [Planctomycetota bacterium]
MSLLSGVVARPIGACVIAVAVVVLGLLSWQRLGVALLPPVESPIITVRADRPGSSATELEEQVLEPLQDVLSTLPGLVAMQGRTTSERVEVQLALDASADVAATIERLRERLASWRRPRGLSEPRILRYDPGAEPLMRLTLRARPQGPNLPALAVAAREDLLPQLESRPSVASALIRGAQDIELQVQVNEAALRALGLSINQVHTAIRDGVETRSAGSIRTSDGNQAIHLRGPITLPEHLPSLPLPGGVRLEDVAEVQQRRSESEELATSLQNGMVEDALLIEILVQSEAPVVAAADDLRHFLNRIAQPQGEGVWDFAGGELHLLSDASMPIRTAIDEVIAAMALGALLAGLVLLLFLRSFASAAVVFLSVPLSVCGAFLVLAAADVTVNLMSLGGLALGIGMLVDNAIVVIESARRHQSGHRRREREVAVARGTGEVASAVIAATLTTLVVFVPLMYAPGILGDLLSDLAWAVVASLGASLAVALLITPPLLTISRQGQWQPLPPRIHAGYDQELPGGWRHPRWWALSLLPASSLLALSWSAPLSHIALASAAIWLVIASAWLWQLRQGSFWRWAVRLPLRLGNLALSWLRWWLLLAPVLLLALLAGLRRRVAGGGLGSRLFSSALGILESLGQAIARAYGLAIERVVKRPALGLLVLMVLVGMGAALGPELPRRLLPEQTNRAFTMSVDLPRSNDVEASGRWSQNFLQALHDLDPQLQAIAIAGEDGRFSPTLDRRQAHQVQVLIQRPQASPSLAEEAYFLTRLERQALAAGALGAAVWAPPLFTIGGTQQDALAIALRGGNEAQLRQSALEWQAQLRLLGAGGVRTSATDQTQELQIIADAGRLSEAGLSWQQFQDRLAAATSITSIESFRPRFDGFTPSPSILPIRVHGSLREAPISALADLDMGDESRPLPLASIARIERLQSSGTIHHRDGRRVATLSATSLPPGISPSAMVAELQRQSPLPPGMSVLDYGLDALTNSHLLALAGLLVLAVFLVLVVMAVQFENLAQPLIVLLGVPMALAGALPALWFTGHGLNVMSGIGLVVLAGISVNNAIVLVTTINLRRYSGLSPLEAIADGARTRLRPIAMTTLTTVLALIPLSLGWGEASALRAPLAVAVIGGMASSSMLILFGLPAILAFIHGRGANPTQPPA